MWEFRVTKALIVTAAAFGLALLVRALGPSGPREEAASHVGHEMESALVAARCIAEDVQAVYRSEGTGIFEVRCA